MKLAKHWRRAKHTAYLATPPGVRVVTFLVARGLWLLMKFAVIGACIAGMVSTIDNLLEGTSTTQLGIAFDWCVMVICVILIWIVLASVIRKR